jgi:hypothetical protein
LCERIFIETRSSIIDEKEMVAGQEVVQGVTNKQLQVSNANSGKIVASPEMLALMLPTRTYADFLYFWGHHEARHLLI